MTQGIFGIVVAILLGRTPQHPVQPVSHRCGLESFAANPSEHIINEIETPIQVSRVQGSVRNDAGGDWPSGAQVSFEIIGPAHHGTLVRPFLTGRDGSQSKTSQPVLTVFEPWLRDGSRSSVRLSLCRLALAAALST